MKSILLIDGNPLMWRAVYAKDEAYITEGVSQYVFKMLSEFDSPDVLMFWDSGKSRIRSSYYPEYKAQRKQRYAEVDMHEIKEQKKMVAEYFSSLGIRNIKVFGVEADDLISWFSAYFSKVLNYDRVIIVSRDRDFFQLIDDKVVLYDYLTGDLFDHAKVRQDLSISPKQVVDLKALVGDTSDNIKGVKGIGEKTAVKLIRQFSSTPELIHPDNFDELNKKKTTQKILNQLDALKLSYQIVQLPTLQGASSFLNEKERETLKKELTKEVKADSMHSMMLAEALNLNLSPPGAQSPLTSEVSGILPYLENNQAQNPSSFNSLDLSILQCRRCARATSCLGPKLAQGYTNAPVMLVTDKPFSEEDMEKINEFLPNIGLNLEECWVTSVCKCQFDQTTPLRIEEIYACLDHLKKEVELLQPKFIITFGSEAMSLFTNYGGEVADHCGEILDIAGGDFEGYSGYVGIMTHPESAHTGIGEANFEFGQSKIMAFLDSKRK